MRGTILTPSVLEENAPGRTWFMLWQEDIDAAFAQINYIGFSYGGMGAEYWTPISHLLTNGIIPVQEYEEAAIRFMDRELITDRNNGIFYDILWGGATIPPLCQWLADNKEVMTAKIERFAKDRPQWKNLAEGLKFDLINCMARAPKNTRLRDFFRATWFAEPHVFTHLFRVAFCIDGKYGPEADKAVLYFIKRSRRLIKTHKYPEDTKREKKEVFWLLRERYGWNALVESQKKISEIPPEDYSTLADIEEKIKRVMRSQNVGIPA